MTAAPGHEAGTAHPVFVGGTGRSGTTIVGAMIASHSRFAGVPFEVRVHVATGLLARRRRPFQWMRDQAMARYESHLNRIVELAAYEELLDTYERASAELPAAEAARNFIDGVMEPVSRAAGKPSWVEMTPLNTMWGSWLHEVFPDMRLIHMLRDGRDVAVSVSAAWGRMDVPEALDWWQQRIEQIAADTSELPASAVLTVKFEDLARDAREQTYERIVDFLGSDDDPAMRSFFETRLVPDRSNIGRWQRDLGPAEQVALTEQYRRILLELREHGTGLPLSDDVD